tara:strand:- start:483 stop:1355 length:873 start_codon:yes stop_codon:yes gene_type:complete
MTRKLNRVDVDRLGNVTREELYNMTRLKLEDGSIVELKDNYLDQLFLVCKNMTGVNLDWLRYETNGNLFFLARNGHKLYVVLEQDISERYATERPKPKVLEEGESHHIVLDQSGSMLSFNESIYEGARELVRELPDDSLVTLTTFNHIVNPGSRMSKKEALSNIKSGVASGTTALRDAILKSIEIEESAPRTKTTIVIVTDGIDNASNSTPSEVCKAVTKCNSRGWRVLFLGANQDAITNASQYGIPSGRALAFSMNRAPDVFRTLSNNTKNHRQYGTDGFTLNDRAGSI